MNGLLTMFSPDKLDHVAAALPLSPVNHPLLGLSHPMTITWNI